MQLQTLPGPLTVAALIQSETALRPGFQTGVPRPEKTAATT